MVSWILFICDQLVVKLTGRVRPQESCPTALLLCHHLQRSERRWHFLPSLFCLLNLSRTANRPGDDSTGKFLSSQRGPALLPSSVLMVQLGLVSATTLHPSQVSPLSQIALPSHSSCPPALGGRVWGGNCLSRSLFTT